MTTIRPATPDDIPDITRVYRREVEAGVATFELDPPDATEMRARMDRLLSGGFPYLVAERDGAFLGSAYAGPYRLRPAYAWSVEDSIYVAPEGRGQGVGRALLARLITECEALNYRKMIAVMTRMDPNVSVRLHAALGFAEVGTLRDIGFKFGRWHDTVIMDLKLGSGGDSAPIGPQDAPSGHDAQW